MAHYWVSLLYQREKIGIKWKCGVVNVKTYPSSTSPPLSTMLPLPMHACQVESDGRGLVFSGEEFWMKELVF